MSDSLRHIPFPHPILIADDTLLQRTVLENTLKSAGYDVVATQDGREAFATFRNGYYPIVITDWIMPEMNGQDLCRAIRADDSGRYTYIIMLSSQESKNDIIAGIEAGADEYLIKPLHQVELLTRLKTARRILNLEESLKKSMAEIGSLSRIDPVTGIHNRRYMDEYIPHEIKRACRYERPLALILIEIVKFRELIDTYGYYAGDVVLQQCAGCLGDSVRKDIDWVARYGEETFIVVLPETDAAGAMILAKRLRIRISALIIKNLAHEIKVTARFGVAGFAASAKKEGMSMAFLFDKAVACLHQAQAGGEESIKGIQIS